MNSIFRSKPLLAGRATQYVLAALVGAILIVGAWPAWGGPQQGGQQGPRLRLELAGYRAFDVDKANGDHYLTGAVFGWRTVDPKGVLIDSCWGYYGYDETKDDAYMIKDCAKPSIDCWCEEQAKESTEKMYWAARGVLTL